MTSTAGYPAGARAGQRRRQEGRASLDQRQDRSQRKGDDRKIQYL